MTMSLAKQEKSRPFTVLVEGNIGCGKTTFLEHFAQFGQVEVLKEPVDRWRDVNGHNLLELMYQDPSRWAMPFQSYVQLTMLDHHLHRSNKPVKLMERSIYSARYCFVENMHRSGKMLGCEFEVLDEWFKFATDDSGLNIHVDLIIYLRTTPEKALERVNIRNRSEENSIPLEYLQDLHNLHEEWLVDKKYPLTAPVLVIDADQDLPEMKAEYRKHETRIFGQVKADLLQSAIRQMKGNQITPAAAV